MEHTETDRGIDIGQFIAQDQTQWHVPAQDTQSVPPPVFTNDQFCDMVYGILCDVIAGDLPDEVIAQLPRPTLLRTILEVIQFDKSSGLLSTMMQVDPQKRLWLGLGATGIYSAYFVLRAMNIKKSLKTSGQYQEAVERTAQKRREEYQKLLEEMQARAQPQAQPQEESNGEHAADQQAGAG